MELDAARWVFERLGAVYDIARLDADSAYIAAATALRPRAMRMAPPSWPLGKQRATY